MHAHNIIEVTQFFRILYIIPLSFIQCWNDRGKTSRNQTTDSINDGKELFHTNKMQRPCE